MKKHVVIFEAEGGSDKGDDGHRRDTMPIVNALKEKGWSAEVIYFKDEKKDEIRDKVIARADAYLSRVNPGSLSNGEKIYFETLRSISDAGVVGMSHPDAMIGFGAKDALTKLTETDLVPQDTYAYYTMEEFKQKFPVTLTYGERVLKQNRGSTGEGIWRVQVVGGYQKDVPLSLDTKIKCTEAVDNHVEERTLGDFMDFCEQYIVGDNGMLVDMKFLPRIKEGELRILLVGENPIFVVHKKPSGGDDAFSATLFSGAKYTYEPPKNYPELVELFKRSLPVIIHNLGNFDVPLIWTVDFILDFDENGKDIYVLGEINNSCVGFTSHLDEGIQEKVAEEVIRQASNKNINKKNKGPIQASDHQKSSHIEN